MNLREIEGGEAKFEGSQRRRLLRQQLQRILQFLPLVAEQSDYKHETFTRCKTYTIDNPTLLYATQFSSHEEHLPNECQIRPTNTLCTQMSSSHKFFIYFQIN